MMLDTSIQYFLLVGSSSAIDSLIHIYSLYGPVDAVITESYSSYRLKIGQIPDKTGT
jgi:hypothetical protein